MSKIICPACKYEGIHACMGWPDDTHISNVAHNGECDQPVYEYKGQQWRMNPVGRYALYFQKGTWRESQQVTNETVLANGVML